MIGRWWITRVDRGHGYRPRRAWAIKRRRGLTVLGPLAPGTYAIERTRAALDQRVRELREEQQP